MRRSLVIAAVVLAAAVVGFVKGPTFLGTRYTIVPASTIGEVWYTAKAAGTGTADSITVHRGSVYGVTDDAVVTLVNDLDTTRGYILDIAAKITNQTMGVRYYVNFAENITAEASDVDGCSLCEQTVNDLAAGGGTDTKLTTSMRADAALGVVEISNRLGVTTQIVWQLTGGG